MVVEVGGVQYLSGSEVARRLGISRQTLWRWRRSGKVPLGRRLRGHQLVFSDADVAAIRRYAYLIEPLAVLPGLSPESAPPGLSPPKGGGA